MEKKDVRGFAFGNGLWESVPLKGKKMSLTRGHEINNATRSLQFKEMKICRELEIW